MGVRGRKLGPLVPPPRPRMTRQPSGRITNTLVAADRLRWDLSGSIALNGSCPKPARRSVRSARSLARWLRSSHFGVEPRRTQTGPPIQNPKSKIENPHRRCGFLRHAAKSGMRCTTRHRGRRSRLHAACSAHRAVSPAQKIRHLRGECVLCDQNRKIPRCDNSQILSRTEYEKNADGYKSDAVPLT